LSFGWRRMSISRLKTVTLPTRRMQLAEHSNEQQLADTEGGRWWHGKTKQHFPTRSII
jgi:hypothetical protein